MRTTVVVAAAHGDVIGRDGDLPWHLPQDLRFFKETTAGGVLLMGRRTHASIGRPLPGRLTVVVSSTPPEGPVVHATTPQQGLAAARAVAAWAGRDEVFVVGGAQVYAALVPQVDRVHLTRVRADVEGDTRLPEGWLDGFVLAESVEGDPDAALPHAFERWERA